MIGRNFREKAVWTVTFLGGLYFVLKFLLPEVLPIFGATVKFGAWDGELTLGIRAVAAMAFGLGLINIFLVHGGKIAYRRAGRWFSTVLLGGMFAMLAAGTATWMERQNSAAELARFSNLRLFAERIVADEQAGTPPKPLAVRQSAFMDAAEQAMVIALAPVWLPELPKLELRIQAARDDLTEKQQKAQASLAELRACIAGRCEQSHLFARLAEAGKSIGDLGVAYQAVRSFALEHTTSQEIYRFLYDGLFVSLASAMFSLLAFYIASAAFRAFRIRSSESALLMCAALIVMLGQIPFGIWIWEGLPAFRLWLLTVPSAGARRAIEFGAAVAGLVMAGRVWLSIETRAVGSRRQL